MRDALETQRPAAPEPGKVVVLIPTFNRPEMLRESVDSVLAQTYPDLEVHIGLDGVGDAVRCAANSYAGDRRVAIHDFRENRGTFAVLEDLIRITQSRYVALFSDDDFMEPAFLERCVAVLARAPEVHPYVYSHVFFWYPDRLEPRPDCGLVNLNAAVFQRAFLDRIVQAYGYCFEPRFRQFYADAVLFRRLNRLGPRAHVCAPLVRWRIHPDQHTKSIEITLWQVLEQAHALHMSGQPFTFRELAQRMVWLVGRKTRLSAAKRAFLAR